jgi:hypothetical protein
MLAEILPFLQDHWLVAITLPFIIFFIRNKYYNGLHKYPGPWLAAYTNWWRFFENYGRKTEKTTLELHKRYGDVVRLGPDVLSFADPKAIKIIYGLNKGLTKVITTPTTA